jgi:channel protein (hemolysin III family)
MRVHALPGLFEPVGALTHLVGGVVFALLSISLLRRAWGDPRRVVLIAVFACACVLLLSMSSVYHMVPEGGSARALLGRLDMTAIFVLIAGTHTPVQGLFFRGVARWGSLALIWLCAVAGATCFTIYYDHLPPVVGTTVYLLLGWAASTSAFLVWRRYGACRVELLILGGLAYTIGAVLYTLNWPTLIPGIFGAHELWHMSVLAGMGLHWAFLFRNANRSLDDPLPARIGQAAASCDAPPLGSALQA